MTLAPRARLRRYLINLRHGEGSCRGRFKEIYSGMWHAGFRHGNGIEMALNGRYRGEWEKNVRVGKGTLELPNGDKCVAGVAGVQCVCGIHMVTLRIHRACTCTPARCVSRCATQVDG